MSAKYSCVELMNKGATLEDYTWIKVDVETGYLWWKKKERISLCTRDMCDWMYPSTGKWVRDTTGLNAAVRLCEVSGGFL